MSIAFLRCFLHLPRRIPCTVVLYVCIGVSSWGWPSSFSIFRISTFIKALEAGNFTTRPTLSKHGDGFIMLGHHVDLSTSMGMVGGSPTLITPCTFYVADVVDMPVAVDLAVEVCS
jgi:hypothetical protein